MCSQLCTSLIPSTSYNTATMVLICFSAQPCHADNAYQDNKPLTIAFGQLQTDSSGHLQQQQPSRTCPSLTSISDVTALFFRRAGSFGSLGCDAISTLSVSHYFYPRVRCLGSLTLSALARYRSVICHTAPSPLYSMHRPCVVIQTNFRVKSADCSKAFPSNCVDLSDINTC